MVIIYFAYLFFENKRLLEENEVLKRKAKESDENYLKLLDEYVQKANSIPESAKTKLTELIDTYSAIDKNITIELQVAIQLLEDGKETIAVEKLTKVIENVLKDKLTSETCIDKKRTFMDAIKEAIKLNLICERIGAFMNALRVIRNEEAHDINVQITPSETIIYLLASVHILFELASTPKVI